MNEKLDWTGRQLELEVGQPAHGGHCVARYEGRVVFVRHGLPGETVLAEVTEDKGGGFCRADVVDVLQPADGRVTPPCPLADIALGTHRCGGCDWQHADAATQHELKASVVTDQLRRIGGIDFPVRVQPLPGGAAPDGLLRWRTRVRMAVHDSGRPGFRPHRSHSVIPVADCPITVEGALDSVVDREWSPTSELEVTKDARGEVHVSTTGRRGKVRRGGRGNDNSKPQVRQIQGSGRAHQEVFDRPFELSASDFWQVHPAAAETFAGVLREMAAVGEGGRVWDLYGGVGLFAAVLAEQVGPTGSVLLVESSRRAVADAAANLRDLPQVRLRTGKVDEVLTGMSSSAAAPDVVVLDPPRKGAGREVVESISAHQPQRVVHLGCDPAALARDLALFIDNGYRIVDIQAFDAFPMTHHVECIALLQRGTDG